MSEVPKTEAPLMSEFESPKRRWFGLLGFAPSIFFSAVYWSFPRFRVLTGALALMAVLSLNSMIGRLMEFKYKQIAADHYARLMKDQRSFGAILLIGGMLLVFIGSLCAKERNWDRLSIVLLSMGFGVNSAYMFWIGGRCIWFLNSIRQQRDDKILSAIFLTTGIYGIVLVLSYLYAIMRLFS
jgi:hypothetical protein